MFTFIFRFLQVAHPRLGFPVLTMTDELLTE